VSRALRPGRLVRDGGGVVVEDARLADRWWSRLRGLLARPPLAMDGSQALVIRPCDSVHTFAMGYALDLVFLDRGQQVCGWRENVPPWRMRACRYARTTIELHAGALARYPPELGVRFVFR